MKLKLGLLVGAGIGYLIGTGKVNEMWNEIKERRPDQDRDTRTTVTVRAEQPVADHQHRHLGHARRLRTSEVELDRGGIAVSPVIAASLPPRWSSLADRPLHSPNHLEYSPSTRCIRCAGKKESSQHNGSRHREVVQR